MSISIVFFIHQKPNSARRIEPPSMILPIVSSKSGSMYSGLVV